MKKMFWNAAFAMAALLFIQFDGIAQVMPQPSSKCMEMRTVGFTEVTIEYFSPGVKGRKIWGELVPFDQAWRAGANAATKITFGTAVKIAGKDVRAGSYQVFITPKKDGEWLVHISTAASVYEYMDRETGKIDMEGLAKKDVATVSVKPTDLAETQERLKYDIDQAENGNILVSMSWEKKKVEFLVETDMTKIMEGIQRNAEMSIK